jgi:thiazole synthase
MIKDTPLIFDGKELNNRLFLGTGKFKSKKDVAACIESSGTQVVTVALRRIDLNRYEDNILEYVPKEINLMVNTSGARNAVEALRIARIAKDAGYGNWIKVEVINDSKYLLPDNQETIKATELLVKEGFIVFPYISPDLYVARALVKAGAAAVMPLGSFIGSNRGLRAGDFIRALIAEIELPVIVDAGIGVPSHAAQAMEMGASAVLVNTAIATADSAASLAKAFSLAVEAGRMAYLAKPPAKLDHASASSPLTGFLFKDEK